jgi:hypothetical protein
MAHRPSEEEQMTSTINVVKRVHGPVARLDAVSEDGRRLESSGAMLPTGRIPILALPPGKRHRPGHAGAVVVGRGRFRIQGDLLLLDGLVADVEVRVPPGRYACGLDIRFADNDMEVRGEVQVFHSWTPLAVTLHRGGRFAGLEELEVSES